MTKPPIRLLVHGASGRVGRALRRLIAGDARFALTAAIVGGSTGTPADTDVPILPAVRLDEAPEVDLVVDFSLAAGFDAVLRLSRARRVPLVSGTTGLSPAQFEAIDVAALEIPLLWAPNFSLGIAVLDALAQRAAAALPSWDCDVVEAHHAGKHDAPSGTALLLGRGIEQARGRAPSYASLRAGDIVGEHTVQFTGTGERLELIHRATDRDIFARGALEAAARLAEQAPGRYRFVELMFPNLFD